jgi:hypothetical protein
MVVLWDHPRVPCVPLWMDVACTMSRRRSSKHPVLSRHYCWSMARPVTSFPVTLAAFLLLQRLFTTRKDAKVASAVFSTPYAVK